jgi:AcrR family transcriptional regulator
MASPAARTDGRSVRGRDNRRRIVEAMMRLVGAGDVSPSAQDVARVAKTGLRTVFRHFEDMDALYGEMAALKQAEMQPLIEAPIEGRNSAERIVALAGRRAAIFESMLPFKSAADLRRPWSRFLQRRHEALVKWQRELMIRALPEIARLDATDREALDLVFSYESWRRLRVDQDLTVEGARDVVIRAARSLLEVA